MTYKELYLKEHPEISSNDLQNVIEAFCPRAFWEGTPEADEGCEMTCFDCWNSEIPEEKMAGFKAKDLVPFGEEVAKGIEQGILESKTSANFDVAEFQKKVYEAFGIPEKTIDKVNEPTIKDIEVKPEFEINGMKVESTDHGTSIKDSGTRREFSTGAVRDIQEGKGRCDLMPLDVIAEYIRQRKSDLDYAVLYHIFCFVDENNTDYLHTALDFFANDHYDGEDYTMFLEVAKHFEAGAKKYSEDNWKKGIPVRCYIDSAVRHYMKFLRGDKDEAHDKAFVWNILCCIWTCKHKPELNDYRKEE